MVVSDLRLDHGKVVKSWHVVEKCGEWMSSRPHVPKSEKSRVISSILMQSLSFLAQNRIIVLPSCCLSKHRSRVDICRDMR
jgi:hypothetical protein